MIRHFKLYFIIFLTLVITLSACRSCPEKKVIGPFLVYPTLDNLLVYHDSQSLVFISDKGNELKFERFINTHKEIREYETYLKEDCEHDDAFLIPYFAEIEVCDYHYATENQDTLKIRYRASVNGWLEDQYFRHVYYKNIDLFGSAYYAISEGRAQWDKESNIETFKNKLEVPYALEGLEFNDVYYWERTFEGHRVLYFNDQFGLVGFDVFDEKWIRKI